MIGVSNHFIKKYYIIMDGRSIVFVESGRIPRYCAGTLIHNVQNTNAFRACRKIIFCNSVPIFKGTDVF